MRVRDKNSGGSFSRAWRLRPRSHPPRLQHFNDDFLLHCGASHRRLRFQRTKLHSTLRCSISNMYVCISTRTMTTILSTTIVFIKFSDIVYLLIWFHDLKMHCAYLTYFMNFPSKYILISEQDKVFSIYCSRIMKSYCLPNHLFPAFGRITSESADVIAKKDTMGMRSATHDKIGAPYEDYAISFSHTY